VIISHELRWVGKIVRSNRNLICIFGYNVAVCIEKLRAWTIPGSRERDGNGVVTRCYPIGGKWGLRQEVFVEKKGFGEPGNETSK
jgi:hypothetical protein